MRLKALQGLNHCYCSSSLSNVALSCIHHTVSSLFSVQLTENKMETVHQSSVTAVIKVCRKPVKLLTLSQSTSVLAGVKYLTDLQRGSVSDGKTAIGGILQVPSACRYLPVTTGENENCTDKQTLLQFLHRSKIIQLCFHLCSCLYYTHYSCAKGQSPEPQNTSLSKQLIHRD